MNGTIHPRHLEEEFVFFDSFRKVSLQKKVEVHGSGIGSNRGGWFAAKGDG